MKLTHMSHSIVSLAVACLPLAAASTASAQQPTPTAIDPSLIAYATTKDSARLPDGRSFHMVCMGKGSPTVILSPGSSGWSENWHTVQPAVAAKTRVCAWDRAGQGLSTGLPQMQAVDGAVTDLQAALKALRIPGPYVAVGASMGGLDSLLLADREPAQVAGMVLVDPSFPEQTKRMDRAIAAQRALAPPQTDQTAGPRQGPPGFDRLLRCIAALRNGTVRQGHADPDGCLALQYPDVYPSQLRAALDKRWAAETPEAMASALEGMHSEPSATIAIKPDRSYGVMPLIVLTAGINPGAPGPVAEWSHGNQDLAKLSTKGVWRLVADSPHDIPTAKPQVVIDAINEVVDAVRAETGSHRPVRR
jgi:pimeloyl-ACP methyl ester carboxylesterase